MDNETTGLQAFQLTTYTMHILCTISGMNIVPMQTGGNLEFSTINENKGEKNHKIICAENQNDN